MRRYRLGLKFTSDHTNRPKHHHDIWRLIFFYCMDWGLPHFHLKQRWMHTLHEGPRQKAFQATQHPAAWLSHGILDEFHAASKMAGVDSLGLPKYQAKSGPHKYSVDYSRFADIPDDDDDPPKRLRAPSSGVLFNSSWLLVLWTWLPCLFRGVYECVIFTAVTQSCIRNSKCNFWVFT